LLAIRLRVAIPPADLAAIARTALASFPHCALLPVSEWDSILLLSGEDCLPSKSRILEAQALLDVQPVAAALVQKQFRTPDVRTLFFSHLWLAGGSLRNVANSQEDQFRITVWNRERALRGTPAWKQGDAARLLGGKLLCAAVDVGELRSGFERAGFNTTNAFLCHGLGTLLFRNGQIASALKMINWGLSLDSSEPNLLADRLIWTGETNIAVIDRTIEHMSESSLVPVLRIGEDLFRRGAYHVAARVFDRLVTLHERSATLWFHLGNSFLAAGNTSRALEAFSTSLTLDPANELAERIAQVKAVSQGTLTGRNAVMDRPEIIQDDLPQASAEASEKSFEVADSP
jgi:tetratricopeptide (TPR) repeat protein